MHEREIVSFVVRGHPEPQPRVKAVRMGKHVKIVTPRTADEWREAVAAASRIAWREDPLERPIEVQILVYVARPKYLMKASADPGAVPLASRGAGDCDNFAKAILDAMEGIVFVNDCQVARLTVEKYFAAMGHRPGARVRVLDVGSAPLFEASVS